MVTAERLCPTVNDLLRTDPHPFRPDGVLARTVRADPAFDAPATDFIDPLELADCYVFTDGSVLLYDYDARCWLARTDAISSFGDARTLRWDGAHWHRAG